MKSIIDTSAFLIIIAASLFLPALDAGLPVAVIASCVSILLSVYLFRKNTKLFVPALFFAINSVLNPFILAFLHDYEINIPQIYFLLPMAIYLPIVFSVRKLKQEIMWLTPGKIDTVSSILIIAVIVVTAASLYAWAMFSSSEISAFGKFIPDIPIYFLILYGLAFPLFNSLFEEFISRALLYDGFAALFRNGAVVITLQATVFAIWHVNGFPGGITGVTMVFAWSILLGILRYRTRGILAPLIAHYFADLSIAIILYVLVIAPVSVR